MRTYTNKLKPTHNANPAKSGKLCKVFAKQNNETYTIHNLQQVVGNQTILRSLQSNAEVRRAAAAASGVNARAFSMGRDVVLGEKYAPGTNEGKHLIAYDLTHIEQQAAIDKRKSHGSDENYGSAMIMRYRSSNSPNFGDNDITGMKEKQYRSGKGYPIIKLINIKFDGIKTIDGESVPSGTLTANYMNVRGSTKPSDISTPVVGGYPSEGLPDEVTSVTPIKIKGWGYNRSVVPISQRNPKDPHYYKKSYAALANMSWAIYFTGKAAIHLGSLNAGSLACVHVGNENKMRQLNYHTLPLGVGTKITVSYTQGALKKPCCERYKVKGRMVNNPCKGQDPGKC